MKKRLVIFVIVSVIVILPLAFFYINKANIQQQKIKCIDVAGKSTTFNNLTSEYILTKMGSFNEFVDIIYNYEIIGIEMNSEIPELLNSPCLYECNLSGGQYWVQKVASPYRPILFYYRLYEKNSKLLILVTYSIQSIRGCQTQDYHAVYEYVSVDTEKILALLHEQSNVNK